MVTKKIWRLVALLNHSVCKKNERDRDINLSCIKLRFQVPTFKFFHWVKKLIFERDQCKSHNFRQIIAKINRLLKKTYLNIHVKFQSDWCKLFRVIVRQRKTTYIQSSERSVQPLFKYHVTRNWQPTYTQTHIFGKRLFFNEDYI